MITAVIIIAVLAVFGLSPFVLSGRISREEER